MEIPYEVKPRPDTGLWNAKILVSGCFSHPRSCCSAACSPVTFSSGSGRRARLIFSGRFFWPHGELTVWMGTLNTVILILSSVFVVIAWLHLKLRDYKKFQMWMGAVVACALAFLVIKSFEYKAKFDHYGIKLADNSIVTGHGLDDTIRYEGITSVDIDVARFNGEFLNTITDGSKPTFQLLVNGEPSGDPVELSVRSVAKIADDINAKLREKADADGKKWFPAMSVKLVSFVASEPFAIQMPRKKLRLQLPDAAKFRDQSLLKGTISAQTPGVTMKSLDLIDLRATDSETAEGSLVWKYISHAEETKKQFMEHRDHVAQKAAEGEEASFDDMLSQPLEHGEGHHYTSIVVPWEDARLYSNFTPKWNTYYALYFLITGLHGLHVLIGACVLFYFGFMSKKLWEKDPEHLTNRVEVAGLFWHFVDLVWIFLFPILYLM